MTSSTPPSPEFLDKVVDFPDGTSYDLLYPLTTYKTCHQGTPLEACVVYMCKQLDSEANQECVMKIKVQLPGNSEEDKEEQVEGPSTTTAIELKALEIFQKANSTFAPKLLGFNRAVQASNCPLPGGYITYTLMSKVPGQSLYDLQYWTLPEEEREDITQVFTSVLQKTHELGIQPEDRGLRNVMWDKYSRTCSIIDFEMWKETKEVFADQTKELRRWGLLRSPPQQWWEIWFAQNG